MNIIELETPKDTEKHIAPMTENKEPFYISEFGKTFPYIPCYQIRESSPIFTLQYVISGGGTIICDGVIYTAEAGDTFLIKKGTNHVYYSKEDNNFERIWINFTGKLAESLIDIYGLSSGVVFPDTNTYEQILKIQKICKKETAPEAYKRKTAIAFLELIQSLADANSTNAFVCDPLEKIRVYINTHILENIKVAEIARTFSYSAEHFIRLFKKTYGITPHKYILQSKIRIAMLMLATSKDSLSSISEKLSFSEVHHFSSQFKKHTGISPNDYRKSFKQKH